MLDLPTAGNACGVVDPDLRKAFQRIRNLCISLRIEYQIDSKIRHMQGSARVGCCLDDRSEWTSRAECGACEIFRATGGLVDGGFSAGGIDWDPMVARVEFIFGPVDWVVGADRDGHKDGMFYLYRDEEATVESWPLWKPQPDKMVSRWRRALERSSVLRFTRMRSAVPSGRWSVL